MLEHRVSGIELKGVVVGGLRDRAVVKQREETNDHGERRSEAFDWVHKTFSVCGCMHHYAKRRIVLPLLQKHLQLSREVAEFATNCSALHQ